MSTLLSLEVPSLVREQKTEDSRYYYLRPVFVNYPVAMHQRLETAIAQYRKELKAHFKNFELQPNNLDQLLWYIFRPRINYHLYKVNFNLGNQHIKGTVGAASFELKGLLFISLPSVRNYIFMADRASDAIPLAEQVERVVKKLFEYLRSNEGKDFVATDYFSANTEFVTQVDVNIRVKQSSSKFDQSTQDFSQLFLNQGRFNGVVELEKVAYNINDAYPSDLKRAFYREAVVEQLYWILFNKKIMTPLVLLGESGMGKHSLVHESIRRYLEGFYEEVSTPVRQVWKIDPNRLIAGMSIVGMWQKRLEAIIEYVLQPNSQEKYSDSLLFDNPIALLRIGKSSQNDMTLSDVLKPYLEERQLQVTVLATPDEWKIVQEKDRRFADMFQVIRLQEPDPLTATKMVLEQRKELEKLHQCQISIQVVQQLFDIHRNYFSTSKLPGGVMKLLTQLAVKYRSKYIDLPEVRAEFKAFAGLEERIFENDYRFEQDEVRKAIGQQLVGQQAAVDALANAIHVVKAKLNNPKKPLASYLFIGPTGVGKTQAAKVVCRYLLGNETQLLRFDMNEYIDPFSVQRLIGDYSNPEGQLTGKVRYQPFGVLLLDEIEKAHPSVHDLLLQVLDDGRLTDSLGRVVDFSNLIIIMTSNIGAVEVDRHIQLGSRQASIAAIYRTALEKRFRPEFINRIDQVVVFNSLEFDHILNIARLQIKELLQRDGFVRRTTILNVSKETLTWVAKRGYNRKLGGRALKRQIERDLTALSADQLIAIQTDSPILFHISFNKDTNQIVPRLQPLVFAQQQENNWIPSTLELNRNDFYSLLMRKLEELTQDLRTGEDQDSTISSENWQHYQLLESIAKLQDKLTLDRFSLDDNLPTPLRFKQIEVASDTTFSSELLHTIREQHQYGLYRFDRTQSTKLNDWVSIVLLKHTCLYAKRITQRVNIRLNSLIDGLGKKEIAYLLTQYEQLLEALEASFSTDKATASIIAEGFSLYDLLQYEEGIHLFYMEHGNPIPIELSLAISSKPRVSAEVIRIYDAFDTMTDLRMGYTIDGNYTVAEHKVLLYTQQKERS